MSERDDTSNPPRRPDFIAYHVQASKDGKGYWNRVGAAWEHKDSKGYELQFGSFPIDGRVSLREQRDERMQGYEDQRQARAADRGPERDRAPEEGRSRGRSR